MPTVEITNIEQIDELTSGIMDGIRDELGLNLLSEEQLEGYDFIASITNSEEPHDNLSEFTSNAGNLDDELYSIIHNALREKFLPKERG